MKKVPAASRLAIGILVLALGIRPGSATEPTPLYYSGILTQGGVPASGTHNVTLRVWNGSVAACPDAEYTGIQLQNGRFRLALGGPCTDAVKANDGLAVEVVVDGTSLGRSALGVVPYAVKAQAALFANEAVTLVGTSSQSLVPAGTILAYAGTTPPTPGWLPCNGQPVLRSQYPALFAAINTSWGQGDTVNTFNVPDLRGLFLRGVNGTGTREPAADVAGRLPIAPGGNSGNSVGSFQASAYASHDHGYYDPGHSHWVGNSGNTTMYVNDAKVMIQNSNYPWNLYSDASTTNITILPSGSSSETRPVNAYVMWIIKT